MTRSRCFSAVASFLSSLQRTTSVVSENNSSGGKLVPEIMTESHQRQRIEYAAKCVDEIGAIGSSHRRPLHHHHHHHHHQQHPQSLRQSRPLTSSAALLHAGVQSHPPASPMTGLLDGHRRRRTAFTGDQLLELEKEFHSKKYLSLTERSQLAHDLRLSEVIVVTRCQTIYVYWRIVGVYRFYR